MSLIRGVWEILQSTFWGLIVGLCATPMAYYLYTEKYGEDAEVSHTTTRYMLSAMFFGVAVALAWTSSRRLDGPTRVVAQLIGGAAFLAGLRFVVWPPF